VKGLKDGIVDTVVWILVNSPYLLVWGIILTILAFAARKLRRGRKAKKVVPPPQNEAK